MGRGDISQLQIKNHNLVTLSLALWVLNDMLRIWGEPPAIHPRTVAWAMDSGAGPPQASVSTIYVTSVQDSVG